MQTNPYEDEEPLAWAPQENRFSERESDKVYSSQQPATLHYQQWQQNMQYPKPPKLERMPKTQALELVNVYKKRLIVASLVAFGLVSGLVAFHQVGTTAATQNQVSPSQSAPVPQPSNGGGYFDQQGGNNFGSGGFGQPQQPSSGSGVS